jgi:hypothetical protein
MSIQESAIWTKYEMLVPKEKKISKKVFHQLFEEYVKHPDKKDALLKKLRYLSMQKGKEYIKKNKSKKFSKKMKNKRKKTSKK